jgi:hypothetical protein
VFVGGAEQLQTFICALGIEALNGWAREHGVFKDSLLHTQTAEEACCEHC